MKSSLQLVEKQEGILPNILRDAENFRVQGEYEKALKLGMEFLNENFDYVPAIVLNAHIFIDTKRFGLAKSLMERAAQLAPDEPIVWNNLGICYEEEEHLDEAEKCFIKALNRNPNDDLALSNLASLYIKKSKPERALNCAEKALRLNDKIPGIKNNVAQAHLMLGNWKEGWEQYDANLGYQGGRRERTYGPIPRWTGVSGLNLIAYGEQGIGDEISFASCLPDLIQDNKVVIECDHRLQNLFARSFNVPVYGTRYYKGGLEWPLNHDIDATVAFGSLPGFDRNSAESFPGKPYLIADPERRTQWRALLDMLDKKKKIGIAWSGGIKKTGKSSRSMPIDEMLPILRQDATFVSLQYRPAPELFDLYENHKIGVHHWPRATETQDYDDTAALIAELDLVITVQTSIVHMCGALGVPCWVMVPTEGALWRYGTQGTQFPWADSVKIYRQKGAKWVHTISEVATDLRERLRAAV